MTCKSSLLLLQTCCRHYLRPFVDSPLIAEKCRRQQGMTNRQNSLDRRCHQIASCGGNSGDIVATESSFLTSQCTNWVAKPHRDGFINGKLSLPIHIGLRTAIIWVSIILRLVGFDDQDVPTSEMIKLIIPDQVGIIRTPFWAPFLGEEVVMKEQ